MLRLSYYQIKIKDFLGFDNIIFKLTKIIFCILSQPLEFQIL